jgi:hypothetical protein
MPLDDSLLDAIAGTIAETEREFRARIESLKDEWPGYTTPMLKELGELGGEINAQKQSLRELANELENIRGDFLAGIEATGKEVQTSLDELAERLDKKSDEREAEIGKAHLVIYDRLAKLRADLAAADERIAEQLLDQLREERLDLDEKMFAARQRYDQLAIEVAERLASVKDGAPGPAGQDGQPGPEGAGGRDGVDGVNGRDGITGEPRGKYDPAESYSKFDRVSMNGSEWIARRDQPGILPGDGWMLGAQGKRGRPGVGIQAASVKGYSLVLEMSDGKPLTVDLRGMFERYDEERGE